MFPRRRDSTKNLASAPSALPPRTPTESRRGPSTAQFARVDASDLYSRNWAFIAPELQEQLATTTIFAAGAGLASTITALACRTGFARFIVADGDQVELSNLNRQAFSFPQIGVNKAEATAEVLRAIRPDVQVELLPQFLDTTSFTEPLARADLVINSIDFDDPALFALNRAAQAAGKPSLFPLNLGWGGAVIVFTPCSPALEGFLGLDPADPNTGAIVEQRLVERIFEVAGGVPPYLARIFADYQAHGKAWPNVPQLGAAAQLTAAMVVRAAVALIAGEPVRTVPEVNYYDLRLLLEPMAPRRQPPDGAPPQEQDLSNNMHTTATARIEVPTTPDRQQSEANHRTQVTLVAQEQAASSSSKSVAGAPPPSRAPGKQERSGDAVEQFDGPARQVLDAAKTAVMAAHALEQRARQRQQEARYVSLLQMANTMGSGVLYKRKRPSGLIAVAVAHDVLSSEQRAAIGEWRLDQYALCGFYNTTVLAARELRIDPAMQELAPGTIHTFAGTADGHLLAYCCVQPATAQDQQPDVPAGFRAKLSRRPQMTMATPGRGWFPTERELFGPEIFVSLASVRETPVREVRELTRLVHNQAIDSPQVGVAVVEVIHALTQVLVDPRFGIRLAIGNIGSNARQAVGNLRMPMLYAHQARVAVATGGPDYDYWIAPANFDRSFWPFVIASADLRDMRAYLRQVDRALSRPAPEEVRSALVSVTRQAKRHLPKSLLRSATKSSLLWVSADVSTS